MLKLMSQTRCNLCPTQRFGFGTWSRSRSAITNSFKEPSPSLPAQVHFQSKRQLWGWLNSIFNQYDKSRVDEVGPDRACAEWLIRCGAGVKWSRESEWFRDYNALPQGNYRKLKIVEIDGTDSAVMHIGFRYFDGLKLCEKVVFHKAFYLEDECLNGLVYLKDCLKDLQISSNGNITDEGILALGKLINLEKLLLYDLPEVKNRMKCIEELSKSLPKCKIDFPYAQASERVKDEPADKDK